MVQTAEVVIIIIKEQKANTSISKISYEQSSSNEYPSIQTVGS